MKTVRRLYFYLVALISIEVVIWGLINLLRSIVGQTVGGAAETLARALALILVGLPIFLFHWLWAQRMAAHDEEERTASLRAIFFYGILIGTLIPLFQNLLALINRTLLQVMRLEAGRALFGGTQTAPDNLIAILINGLVALYFWTVLRAEWASLPAKKDFADARRLFRYVWVIYALLMVIFGAQQILRYIFYVPSGVLGELTRETIVNGISLLLIGTPLWVYAWNIVQRSVAEEAAEHESNLRLAILYVLALSGVITVLTAGATLLHTLISTLLGRPWVRADFVNAIGGPISIGLPLGAIWAYYGTWLNRHIESITEPVRQAGMKRVYYYILSALGVGGTFLGVAMLIQFMINLLTGGYLQLSDALRSDLGRALGVIIAWLPLWIIIWRRLQAESAAIGDSGDHARRSIVRRAYLYLALFAGVIGGMISAVAFVFRLINTALSGQSDSGFVPALLNDLRLVILFAILLIYHLLVMRRDGRWAAAALAAKQVAFKVLVVDSGTGFGDSIRAAMAKVAPNVPVTVTARQPRGKFEALVVSGSQALNGPLWIRSFKGTRIIVPEESDGTIWAGGVSVNPAQRAALAVRQLAEGQGVRQRAAGSGWMIVVYVAAALFGLEFLLGVFGLIMSTFMNR